MSALDHWRAALAAARTIPARWLAIGDSITEGIGATTAARRWTQRVLSDLRSGQGLPSGGAGSIAGFYAGAESWASSLVASDATVNSGIFGYRAASVGAGQHTTFTFTGTHFQIWYGAYASAGVFSYAVDGGSPTTINAGQVSPAYQPTSLIAAGGGSHTVVVSYVSGSAALIAGIQVFDGDTTAGITFYDASRSAVTSEQYVGGGGVFYDYAFEPSAWALMAPDLVTIELGLNDAFNALSPASMATNIGVIVGNLKALAKVPSILIIASYAPAETVLPLATWVPYVAALASLATAQGAQFLDLSAVMPQATTSGGGLYTSDGVHPNDSGHAAIAGHLLDLVQATRLSSHPYAGAAIDLTTSFYGGAPVII